MFPTASLLTTLLLAVFIAASQVEIRSSGVSLSSAKRLDASNGAINLVKQDQARAAALKERGLKSAAQHASRAAGSQVGSANLTYLGAQYIVSANIGTPPTTYDLIVDTGFSNTWIGNDKPYVHTNSSLKTGDKVSVSYGSASFTGEEWVDTLTLSDTLIAYFQSIGVATQVSGIPKGVDGVIGLGQLLLTVGTLSDKPTAAIPTVVDTFYAMGGAPLEIVSMGFAPPTSVNDVNGVITFGGTNSTRYTGDIDYTPITSTFPASNFWGIDQSLTYGERTLLSQTAGVVDTGTTLILIASDAYEAYKTTTGGAEDEATGLLKFSSAQYDQLQNLNFNVYSQTYSLTPNGQIWPRVLNSYIGGSDGSIYSIINSIGTPSGQGFDFINGQAFIERFYTVFDTWNWQVGFATTSYTNATTN